MSECLEFADISIQNPLHKMGVIYVGQYGTSGYAAAAKGYICDFIMKGIPVNWVPLKFDDSILSDDNFYNIIAKSVINKTLTDLTTIILHCTADLWPAYKKENHGKFHRKTVIGYTVWETNKLPDKWPQYINENVNEVWCPSKYNYNTFKESGVTIPIRVVPHIFLKQELPAKAHILLQTTSGENITLDPNIFTFYNISELNERKNVTGLLHAYCKAFTNKDHVRLILKVHYKDYTSDNVQFCIQKIKQILQEYPNHAKVILLSKNLIESELLALHALGNCYVSLTRSEAFGLTIHDAFHYGKKIIVPGCGGQVDYLGPNYNGLISYNMIDVHNMDTFSHGYYTEGVQQWAEPNIDHAVEIMRKTYNDQ